MSRRSRGIRQRAVRLVLEHRDEYETKWGGDQLGRAAKIGCSGETLHGWVRQVEIEGEMRALGAVQLLALIHQ